MTDDDLRKVTALFKRRYSEDYDPKESADTGHIFNVLRGEVNFQLMYTVGGWSTTNIFVDGISVAIVSLDHPTKWLKDSANLRHAVYTAVDSVNKKRLIEERNIRERAKIKEETQTAKEEEFDAKWNIQ